MKRALRRHHLERIKRRMTRYVRCWWHRGFQGRGQLDKARAGKMAAMHGTHICMMCHYDKLYGKKKHMKTFWPLAQSAVAPDSDSGGSRFETWEASQDL